MNFTWKSLEGGTLSPIGNKISRKAFFEIAMQVTNGQQRRKSAVDYVLGELVYDNLNVARDIVSKDISEKDMAEELMRLLDAVEQFLKFLLLEHISSDGDIFHDPNLAHSDLSTNRGNDNVYKTSFNSCISLFELFTIIENSVSDQREEIKEALCDVTDKTIFYMGHQNWCQNQESSTYQVISELRSSEYGCRKIIIIYYKMKFEEIRFREKTK